MLRRAPSGRRTWSCSASCSFLAGLLFKIAAVPFHVWTPDVYEGSPTPVTAFFSVGPSSPAYAILARIFYVGVSRSSTPTGA